MSMAISKSENSIIISDLLAKVHQIGESIIRPAATAVDAEARFPHEALEALRKERLLAAYIPQKYGGLGLTISQLAAIAQALAQYCSSTAMIWSMHQIKLATVVNHINGSEFFEKYLCEAAEKQLLIASITSEVGVGGDVRTSIAAIETTESGCKLEKKSTAISYGAYADDFLATARRHPDAASSDQVLVLLRKDQTTLVQTGTWNTLGMRGTCSPGFNVSSTFPAEHILAVPFADISIQSMVPFAHLLWSSCWLGIATDALGRARKYMQAKARQQRVTSLPGESHLIEATSLLQLMSSNINETLAEYERLFVDEEHRSENVADLGFAIRLNNVKMLSSQLVVKIVGEALAICGMLGYKEDSSLSVTRHLRDSYSASLMISNDRLYDTNAALLLIHKQ